MIALPKQYHAKPAPHTPGEWSMIRISDTARILSPFGVVAVVKCVTSRDEANLRVMAGGSAMLELLKRAQETAPHDLQYEIAELVAKVEGR